MSKQTDLNTDTLSPKTANVLNPNMVENDDVLTNEEWSVLMTGGLKNKKSFSEVAMMTAEKKDLKDLIGEAIVSETCDGDNVMMSDNGECHDENGDLHMNDDIDGIGNKENENAVTDVNDGMMKKF